MAATLEQQSAAPETEARRHENASSPPVQETLGEQYTELFGRVFGGASGEQPADSAARFLSNSTFSNSVNSGLRVVSLKHAQQTHGSRFAQRLVSRVQRKPAASRFVQRQCSCGGACEKCSPSPVQASALGSPSISPPFRFIQTQTGNSTGMTKLTGETSEACLIPTDGGKPLDDRTRGLMEARFGRDFSDVRMHTDGRADTAAKEPK